MGLELQAPAPGPLVCCPAPLPPLEAAACSLGGKGKGWLGPESIQWCDLF